MSLATQAETNAGAVKWSRLGFTFEARAELYQTQQQKLLLASTDIAETLSEIQLEKLAPDIREQIKNKPIVLIFEKNSATDAMFFPPGTKRDGAEWIITLNPVLLDTPNYQRIIVHEYFHAAHHSVKPNEKSWVREGLAQLFEYQVYGGFNFAHIHAGLTESNFPLEASFDVNNYQPEKYGNTLLYFYYLTTHCDKNEQLFWALTQSEDNGREGITQALQAASTCRDFASTATGFSLAKIMNSYSGFDQSAQTFIHASAQRLSIDSQNEKKALAYPESYWKNIKAYQPQRLSQLTAIELAKSAPETTKWWGVEKNYPNRIKAIKPTEISTLAKSWDIGFFIAE